MNQAKAQPIAILGALLALTATAGAAALQVSWSLNPATEGILAYCVEYRHESTPNWLRVVLPPTQTSHPFALTNGGQWYFRGCASNAWGEGPMVAPVLVALPSLMRDFKVTVTMTLP